MRSDGWGLNFSEEDQIRQFQKDNDFNDEDLINLDSIKKENLSQKHQ